MGASKICWELYRAGGATGACGGIWARPGGQAGSVGSLGEPRGGLGRSVGRIGESRAMKGVGGLGGLDKGWQNHGGGLGILQWGLFPPLDKVLFLDPSPG